jgi:hypothetical protein
MMVIGREVVPFIESVFVQRRVNIRLRTINHK